MLVAITAVGVSIRHYNATEAQRRAEDARERRIQFLDLLNTIAARRREHYTVSETHKEAATLGTMQASISAQCLLMLIQAEALLPDVEKQGVVYPAEYLLLARESLNQGLYEAAERYSNSALTSKNPEIRADATSVIGSIRYLQGSLDEARDKFEESLAIFDGAKELLAESQHSGKIQICVSWCELEMDFGDQSYKKAEEIMGVATSLLPKVRSDSFRDSAKLYFDGAAADIKKWRDTDNSKP
jgi:tetratricopeptide (TPR) repeat protein